MIKKKENLCLELDGVLTMLGKILIEIGKILWEGGKTVERAFSFFFTFYSLFSLSIFCSWLSL